MSAADLDKTAQAILSQVPAGRFGEPGEIVVFKGPDTWTPEVSVAALGDYRYELRVDAQPLLDLHVAAGSPSPFVELRK